MQSFNVERQDTVLERAVGGPVPSVPPQTAEIERSWSEAATSARGAAATESLKVSTRSRPSAVAGAIAGVLREHGQVEVQTIGAGATNQAIKAIAIARAYLVDDGFDVQVVPSFLDLLVDGQERTALRMFIQRQPR